LFWFQQDKAATAAPVRVAPAPTPAPRVEAPPPALEPAKAPAPEATAQGNAPALARAPEKPAAVLLAPEKRRRIEGYGAGRNPLLLERIAATREKLESTPDTAYSIELFITENSDAARTERFLLRARELVPLAEVYVIPVAAAGSRYSLQVAYGTYPSRESAAEAAKRLPPKYQNAFRFQLRSFADLRGAV
jgi:hypothetical protein